MMSTLTSRISQVSKLALDVSIGIMSRLFNDAVMLEDLKEGWLGCQTLWTASKMLDTVNMH